VFGPKDDPHTALSEPRFKNVPAAERSGTSDSKNGVNAIDGANLYLVIVTITAFRTFFHDDGPGKPPFLNGSDTVEKLSLARKIGLFNYYLGHVGVQMVK
jgi:hypothetical protein